MIVRNEEPWLARCLNSVRSAVDEIVVVDTGSTDRTAEIASRFGARVFSEPWREDFAAARNVSLREATGDWILVLDADEVIPVKVLPKLRRAIEEPFADAYRMTTRNYRYDSIAYGCRPTQDEFEEEKGYPFWVPSTKIRLFRRLPGIEFRGAVHELVEESVRELGLKVADLPVPVLHFGDADKRRSPVRYLRAAERKVQERPEDPLAFQELAGIQARAGLYEEAIRSCDRALQLLGEGKGSPYVSKEIILLIRGQALQNLGAYEEAAKCYQEGLRTNPRSHELANNLGVCYECLGNYEEAVRWYQRAYSLCPERPLSRENLKRARRKLNRERSLSVCLIVRDAAATLSRALDSARHFADEIVVVDTGSKDETLAIAERFGARIGYFAWRNDFAAARNASLELATGDWILWLDADDYVPPTEWPKIQELKYQPLDRAFMFLLQNEGVARETCWQVRMFPNRPELRFRFPVHEQIVPALEENGYTICTAPVTVVHTGYASHEVVQAKKERYLRMLQKHVSDNPEDGVSRYHLAFLYHTLGRQQEAIREFREVLSRNLDLRCGLKLATNAWLYLGRALLATGALDEAEEALRKAQEYEPGHPLVLVSLAQLYNARGEPERALAELGNLGEQAIPPTGHPIDLEALAYAIAYQRGLALEALGRYREAVDAYLAAQEKTPRFDPAAKRVGELIVKIGDGNEVDRLVAALTKQPASVETLTNVGLTLAQGQFLAAARTLLETATRRDPGHITAWRALARVARYQEGPEAGRVILLEAAERIPESEDLMGDLVELLLEEERLDDLASLPYPQAWPARLAAHLLRGDPDGVVEVLERHLSGTTAGADLSVETVWRQAVSLNPLFRFLLAVACAWLEPSLLEAAEVAVRGWLERGKTERALALAEHVVLHNPNDPGAFELLKICYARLGVRDAVRMCEERIALLRQMPATLVGT
ncbi:MAG: glycosyltransferase [candidate division KSB1 bacterium]|nr:glycosyltransferase [candidate division KSB1 bacterium]